MSVQNVDKNGGSDGSQLSLLSRAESNNPPVQTEFAQIDMVLGGGDKINELPHFSLVCGLQIGVSEPENNAVSLGVYAHLGRAL